MQTLFKLFYNMIKSRVRSGMDIQVASLVYSQETASRISLAFLLRGLNMAGFNFIPKGLDYLVPTNMV